MRVILNGEHAMNCNLAVAWIESHAFVNCLRHELCLTAHWLQFNSCERWIARQFREQIMERPIHDASASIHMGWVKCENAFVTHPRRFCFAAKCRNFRPLIDDILSFFKRKPQIHVNKNRSHAINTSETNEIKLPPINCFAVCRLVFRLDTYTGTISNAAAKTGGTVIFRMTKESWFILCLLFVVSKSVCCPPASRLGDHFLNTAFKIAPSLGGVP